MTWIPKPLVAPGALRVALLRLSSITENGGMGSVSKATSPPHQNSYLEPSDGGQAPWAQAYVVGYRIGKKKKNPNSKTQLQGACQPQDLSYSDAPVKGSRQGSQLCWCTHTSHTHHTHHHTVKYTHTIYTHHTRTSYT